MNLRRVVLTHPARPLIPGIADPTSYEVGQRGVKEISITGDWVRISGAESAALVPIANVAWAEERAEPKPDIPAGLKQWMPDPAVRQPFDLNRNDPAVWESIDPAIRRPPDRNSTKETGRSAPRGKRRR